MLVLIHTFVNTLRIHDDQTPAFDRVYHSALLYSALPNTFTGFYPIFRMAVFLASHSSAYLIFHMSAYHVDHMFVYHIDHGFIDPLSLSNLSYRGFHNLVVASFDLGGTLSQKHKFTADRSIDPCSDHGASMKPIYSGIEELLNNSLDIHMGHRIHLRNP